MLYNVSLHLGIFIISVNDFHSQFMHSFDMKFMLLQYIALNMLESVLRLKYIIGLTLN